MTARELRIGNYVYECLVQKDIIRVDIDTLQFNCELIEPIPLTEEWLLNFGFNKTDDSDDYFEEGSFVKGEVCIDSTMELAWYSGAPLNYVHQLQNLFFALTGEELKLKK